MKRIMSLIVAALFCGFLLIAGHATAGDGAVLDQSYAVLSNTGYGSVGIGGTGQTFIPTKNRVTSIDVYFKNRQTGTSITMTVKNFATKQVIGTETHSLTFAGDAAWEPFVFDSNLVVVPGTTYAIYLTSNIDNQTYWMTGNDGIPYSRGVALTGDAQFPVGEDRLFMTFGKDVADPAAPGTTTTTTTGTSATVATAPTVSPSVLAIPKNFRVDRNLGEEIIFAWDINTEAGVTGYAMFIYDGDTEKEVIDIPGKDVDNYNLILKDHLLLSLNKSYNVKLAAKNTTGISEKTTPLSVTFKKAAVTSAAVNKDDSNWLVNPWVLGGLGLLVVALIGLLIFLEKKYHGLANLAKKMGMVKSEKNE